MEALQKISDDLLTKCPACEKSELKKLISAASFRLKGGGWYETDFKTGEKKQLAESDSSAPKSSESEKSSSKPDGSTQPANESKASKASESKGKKDSGKNSNNTSSAKQTAKSN